MEPVNHKEKGLEDEDEEQGPGDAKRAVLKPEGEPLQAEDHDAEEFVQVAPHNRLGLFADTVDGRAYYWHGGFWGTIVYYSPDTRRSAAAVTTNAAGFTAVKELAGEAAGIPDGKVPALRLP